MINPAEPIKYDFELAKDSQNFQNMLQRARIEYTVGYGLSTEDWLYIEFSSDGKILTFGFERGKLKIIT